jgi:hypothetical protein
VVARNQRFSKWLSNRESRRRSWKPGATTPWIAEAETVKESITDHLSASLGCQHFSDLLLADSDFRELAKISMFGPVESFFETLSDLSSHDDELVVDSFCQRVNLYLVTELGKFEKRKPTASNGLHRKVMEYLQSSGEFANDVSTFGVAGLRNPVGLSSIVLTLTRMLFERIAEAYEKKQAELIEEANQKEAAGTDNNTAKGLVNNFVGFGVGKAIRGIVSKMGGEDECNTSLWRNSTILQRQYESFIRRRYCQQAI